MSLRKECFFCKNNINPLFKISNFPEAPRATKITRSEKIDFVIGQCSKCSLIQQLSKPRISVLYEEFKNDVVGEKLDSQKKEFLKYIYKQINVEDKISTILEYGAGNCMIAKEVASKFFNSSVYVNDYNLNLDFKAPKNLFLKEGDFIYQNFSKNQFDVIYSSHVFEHINDFENHINISKSILKNNGLYIIALPFFEKWITNKNLNAFSAEHSIYPFKDDLINLFKLKGFIFKDIDYYRDHSLFITFRKINNAKKFDYKELNIDKSYKEKLVLQFDNYLNLIKQNLSLYKDKDYKIVGFGANTSSQIINKILNQLSMDFEYIVDNSKKKQGCFLFGTNCKIYDPIVLKKAKENTIVIIFLGPFNEEVSKQIKLLNPSIKIFTRKSLLSDLSK